MARNLILIRHGESEGNLDGSGSDTPLTPRGRSQGESLAARLSGLSFTLATTSPLTRARETAALALPNKEVVVDVRLAEFTPAPDAEFLDVSRLTPAELTALLAVPPQNDSFESGRDFMARVRAWLDDVPATGTTIAFTHYAVVREILGALLGSRHAPTEISHASIHHFRLDDSGIHIVASNDIEHLQR